MPQIGITADWQERRAQKLPSSYLQTQTCHFATSSARYRLDQPDPNNEQAWEAPACVASADLSTWLRVSHNDAWYAEGLPAKPITLKSEEVLVGPSRRHSFNHHPWLRPYSGS